MILDIVHISEMQKCGFKYSHSQNLNGVLKKRSQAPQFFEK